MNRPVIGHGPSTAPPAHPTIFCLLDTHGLRRKSDGHPRRLRYRRHAASRVHGRGKFPPSAQPIRIEDKPTLPPFHSPSPAMFISPRKQHMSGEIRGEQPAAGEVGGDSYAADEVGREPHASGERWGAARIRLDRRGTKITAPLSLFLKIG
jgi:hypothetical protein